MVPLFEALPYPADSAMLFEALAETPWSLFFDSAPRSANRGRYDIICTDPMATLVMHQGEVRVAEREGSSRCGTELFAELRRLLGERRELSLPGPFAAGAAGYFGYDLGRRLEGLSSPACETPEAMLGIYDWAVVVDHQTRRAWMAGEGRDPQTRARWRERVEMFRSAPPAALQPFSAAGPVVSNMERSDYGRAFARVQRYIREGDCYQVNLARRFTVAVEGSPWSGYRRLRAVNPAPFAAYLNFPQLQVLSASPEQFLSVEGDRVVTRPIKGTRPRGEDPAKDGALTRALKESDKDRAENLMIVDLLRNDLGKSCAIGTIEVPELFQVESFATVHHLVSTVSGRLAPGRDLFHLLAGSLPGGSITGAPKRRAMEIIEELEPHRREVYCGAIGYMGIDGRMDSNIAIRTLVHRRGEMRFWAGGGIVADSVAQEEFAETEHKAAGMRKLFGDD